ncbi:MAG TPA: hypothetical protein VFZ25_00145 [Chloroflexota bacterium]|nr:hypothetical protein [Chloroflexota bacterium]
MSEPGHIPTSLSAYPLARGDNWRDTPLARWATSLACRLGLPTDPVGRGVELDGDDLAELQRRAQDAFVRPVYRIVLHEPLLAFRFYGDRCLPITRLYTSIATVRQIPRFGWLTKELLGLTGRNAADNLIAVRVAPGSRIAVGGISNRATWADQILVEVDRGLLAVGHLSQAECEFNNRTKRAS